MLIDAFGIKDLFDIVIVALLLYYIYRIMKDRNMISEEFDVADFFDWHEVSDYAKTAVGTLSKFGIVQGSNGSISPLNNMIRAEGAVMMYRIYKEVLQ